MATIIEPGKSITDSSELYSRTGQQSFWRDSAPTKILSDKQWQVWSKHVAKNRATRNLGTLLAVKSCSLSWGFENVSLSSRSNDLLAALDAIAKKPNHKTLPNVATLNEAVADWARDTDVDPARVDFALDCLAIAQLLPWLVDVQEETDWWHTLASLLSVVELSTDWRTDAELPPEQGLVHQLLVGELPLLLAYSFPEIKLCYSLRSDATAAVSESLSELTNGQGMVRGPYLAQFLPLLASWTRASVLADQLKKCSLSDNALTQLGWAATQSLRLSSDDGRWLAPHGPLQQWTPDSLAAVLQNAGDRSDVSTALDIFGKKLTKGIQVKPNDRFPEVADNCEWAGVASLRTEWERSSPALVVDYSTPEMSLAVGSGKNQVIRGTWSWETSVDDQLIKPCGSWEETCWFSDDDVDYLELALELEGGLQLDRQILLARDEEFLLLADYVLKTGGGEVKHRMRLPLDGHCSLTAERETREGLLVTDKPVGRVIPLALPEWRIDPRFGELAEIDGHLQLAQHHTGNNLACPLLIDLNASRSRKPCTWRQLTIAQSLEIQPHDVAVGYRAQCGKDQWLLYRSLTEAANRSLLGQNFSCECVVARFIAPAGEIDELLQIDA